MALTMGIVPLIRLVVLGTTILFSLLVFAISANLISQTEQYYRVTVTFSALSIAVGIISLLTLPVLLVVDILRRGAFTSKIVVELSWLSLLTVLWVATAGTAVSGYNLNFPLGCNYVNNSVYNGLCQQTEAIEAFSWLNFIILLFYTNFLTVMSALSASRGNAGIWFSTVKESFSGAIGPGQHAMTQYNVSSPPQPYPSAPVQPQYTGTPIQSPHVTGQPISV